MNKTKYIMFTFLASLSLSAQQNFEITKENPEIIGQYIVIEKQGLSISDGYQKVLEWINIYYNTPDEVIKSQLEDKYIRIEGYDPSFTVMKTLGINYSQKGKYSISFAFKENRIKVEITKILIYTAPSQYNAGGWAAFVLNHQLLYKKNGKPKKQLTVFANGVVDSLNEVKNNLEQYINNPLEVKVKTEDW